MRDQLHLKTSEFKLRHKYAWIMAQDISMPLPVVSLLDMGNPYPLYQTLRALLTHTDLLFIFHTLLEYKRTLYQIPQSTHYFKYITSQQINHLV